MANYSFGILNSIAISIFCAVFGVSSLAHTEQRDLLIALSSQDEATLSRLKAELESMGFVVKHIASEKPEDIPNDVIAWISEENEVHLHVWIRKEGEALSLRESVLMGIQDDVEGESVIRAVEALRAGLLRVGIALPDRPGQETNPREITHVSEEALGEEASVEKEEASIPEPAGHHDRAGRFGWEAGWRLNHSQGGSSVAQIFSLGGRYEIGIGQGLRLDFGVPLVPSRLEGAEGRALLHPYTALMAWWIEWSGADPFILQADAGIKGVWLHMVGEASPPFQSHQANAWLGGPSLGAGAAWRWSEQWSLVVSSSVMWAQPSTKVRFVGRRTGGWGDSVLDSGLSLRYSP